MEPSYSNGSRVIMATAAESLAFSAARNFPMKPSNCFCKAGEATAFFGAWAKAGARCTRAAASTIPNKNFMVHLRPSDQSKSMVFSATCVKDFSARVPPSALAERGGAAQMARPLLKDRKHDQSIECGRKCQARNSVLLHWQLLADCVAKLQSCRATNFSRKPETGSDRRLV